MVSPKHPKGFFEVQVPGYCRCSEDARGTLSKVDSLARLARAGIPNLQHACAHAVMSGRAEMDSGGLGCSLREAKSALLALLSANRGCTNEFQVCAGLVCTLCVKTQTFGLCAPPYI